VIFGAQGCAEGNDLLNFLFEAGKRGVHGRAVCWKNGYWSSSSRRL
jgi:hypothetical protein